MSERAINAVLGTVGLIALLAGGGFFVARSYDAESLGRWLGVACLLALALLAVVCVYAGVVGIYHTLLAVTGLDVARRRSETGTGTGTGTETEDREPLSSRRGR